jgi:hypothetical protein
MQPTVPVILASVVYIVPRLQLRKPYQIHVQSNPRHIRPDPQAVHSLHEIRRIKLNVSWRMCLAGAATVRLMGQSPASWWPALAWWPRLACAIAPRSPPSVRMSSLDLVQPAISLLIEHDGGCLRLARVALDRCHKGIRACQCFRKTSLVSTANRTRCSSQRMRSPKQQAPRAAAVCP